MTDERLWINLVVAGQCNQCDRAVYEKIIIEDFDPADSLGDMIRMELESDRRPAVLCTKCTDKFRAEVEQGAENPYAGGTA